MSDKNNEVRGKVTELIRSILTDNGIDRDFSARDKLADVGLTSMDMVSLMLGIEGEFGIVFPEDDITPENFNSVETVEVAVIRILQVDHATG